MKKFIVRCRNFQNDHWVTGTAVEGEVTKDRNKATIFTVESDLEYWQEKSNFELIEIGEDEWMRRQGQEIAPRLPGF